MTSIMTRSGRLFDVANPSIKSVLIQDIAGALSKLCRYGGQCLKFYSVAEHSVEVARSLRRDGYDKKTALAGLLHDASEAYLCDIPSPIKPLLTNYKQLEYNIQAVIFSAFGLEYPLPTIVTEYDRRILADEWPQVMVRTQYAIDVVKNITPLNVGPLGTSPQCAEELFMDWYRALS